ncbi:MAG: hypothetical protein KGQ46_07765 [Hyphomicrobiales bacterium]|nr:hypothetical protein [Hyphomicrobiales bacterium]MDE2114174.1 hypothetical protein [Hyphomicrobiales bacterium]
MAIARIALVSPAAMAAENFASPWGQGIHTRARLIDAGGPQAGGYLAGVAIELDPKTVTYWRSPGEAGVPPTFDFAASQNVAKAEVLYPAPKRIPEAGAIVAFGYEDKVVFPVRVTAVDPNKPVELNLKLNYAACEKLCVPVNVELHLALQPVAVSSPYATALASALQQVPAAVDAGKIKLTPVPGTKKPSWQLSTAGLPIAASDLFVEVPAGYFADAAPVKASGAAAGDFIVTLSEYPTKADLHAVKMHLTATGTKGAVEWDASLDADRAKP